MWGFIISDSFISRPIKELKAFDKIDLKSGEEKTVKFALDRHSFEYFNICNNGWGIEEGRYDIIIGASSADIRLKASINL